MEAVAEMVRDENNKKLCFFNRHVKRFQRKIVTWTNNDATTHTVTADDGSFNSGNIAPGGKFSHTFSTAGTIAYHCSIHTSMKAKVVVAN